MASFNLDDQSYIALARRSDLDISEDAHIWAAVYAPGMTCTAWSLHYDKANTLKYGYLARLGDQWNLMGRNCLINYRSNARPGRWKTMLDNRHPLAGLGVRDDWRSQTRRSYWRVVPMIGLMIHVEPRSRTRKMLRGYLDRITSNKQQLTDAQRQTLWDIICERGDFVTDDHHGDLDRLYRVLKQRRDAAFRLARLSALHLSAADRERVCSLRKHNTTWRYNRMKQLSDSQLSLLKTLEVRYLEQRREATQALIQRLVDRFQFNRRDPIDAR